MAYIVSAKKVTQQVGGIYYFGPIEDEEEAVAYSDRVADHPDWDFVTVEVPVLNPPEAAFDGSARQ